MSLKSATLPFKGKNFKPTLSVTANVLRNIRTRYRADTAEPEAAAESTASKALEERQISDLARLDEQESERIKRIKRGRIGVFTSGRSTLGGGLVRNTGSGSSGGTASTGGRTGTPSMGSGSTT